MAMMGAPVFTPLKEGQYRCRIEKVGINQQYERDEEGNFILDAEGKRVPIPLTEEQKELGYYIKKEVEGKNNNYFRLDLITTEGKRTNRNVFPENINIVISNIKRQLNIEDNSSTFEVLNKCLTEGCELDMWVWYRESNKNVDFYNAPAAEEARKAANTAALESLLA